ncbi:sugar ABC transporter substrate-binding protein [Paenibacillus thalictri]|uniref:Sugar ABC transporter substrate-binding protein n=1 Tax=Paenibacillus thalictri TaxID=2527873 RepID=A0A4Q9DYX3_9BACL|nr:substrate-binding domain-containing protein [Paenibacillus thalictri]TBL81113.1 sugar ABC transporter substrate-binding protein [Paenibacillus thalictri]
MRILFILTVSVCCVVTLLFSGFYAYRIYQSAGIEQAAVAPASERKIRVVMIAQELESPFTKALQIGFSRFAKENNMEVSLWGTYHANLIELLKYMDIAIASKVDGIVVQAMDGPEFVDKVQKATGRGIPVITVGVDAPDSLRKSYVGPDHRIEGALIGFQIAGKLQGSGMACIISGRKLTRMEELRLQGVKEALAAYPAIKLLVEEGGDSEQGSAKQLASTVLNRYPDLRVFAGLNEEAGIGIVQALNGRGRGDHESVYAFDDTLELRRMVDARRMTATLSNDNTSIGEKSLILIRQWQQNVSLPLPREVFTQVSLYEGTDRP